MTLPNKITLSRILLAPVVFTLFQVTVLREWKPIPGLIVIGVIFILSEISDLLDGYLARKSGQVTDIGKLMDPFADVICRVTYFVSFTLLGIMPAWTLIIILYREFSVMFLRMWMLKTGSVAMGARWGGKLKSLLYFFASLLGLALIAVGILFPDFSNLRTFTLIVKIVFMASAAAALMSLGDYFIVVYKNAIKKSSD